RRRPRVVGAAVDDDLAACLAEDRGHDPDRLAGALEHRALLHVQLEERRRQATRGGAGAAPGAAALLVTERDDREREPGMAGRDLDPGDDAERAVEAAAVRDGV